MQSSGGITTPIAIIHDNRFTRNGLRLLLENESDFHLIGAYASCEEAFADPRFRRVHIVLMDNRLLGMDSLEGIRQLKQRQPDTAVVLCTAREESPDILNAIRTGAVGFIAQKSGPENTLKVLRIVLSGGSPLNPFVARAILQQERPALSPLQRRILKHAARGESYHTIARQLGCSTTEVFREIRRIYRQLSTAATS